MIKLLIKLIKIKTMFRKRNDGTKHPIQSLTVWGILMSIIAPILSQLFGVDVTTITELIQNFNVGDNKHTFMEWLQIAGQFTGYMFMCIGTFRKQRKPVSFEDNSIIEE